MSSLSIWTATGGAGWACGRVTGQTANTTARPTPAVTEYNHGFVIMSVSFLTPK
jgi:hypothetical protein